MDTIHKSSNQQLSRDPNNVIQKSSNEQKKPSKAAKTKINLNEYPEYPNGRRVARGLIIRPKFIIDQTCLTNHHEERQTKINPNSFPIQTIEDRQVVAPEVPQVLNSGKNKTSNNYKQKKTTKLSSK